MISNSVKYAILIVDDEATIHEIIKKSLKSCEIEVRKSYTCQYGNIEFTLFHASNILQEESILKKVYVDLVIQDVVLPDGNGIKYLNENKHKWVNQQMKALVLTSQTDLPTREKALLYGKSDYLSKPFFPKELCLRVLKLLEIKREQSLYESYANCEYLKFSQKLQKVIINGVKISLTKSETELIDILFISEDPISLVDLTKKLSHLNGKKYSNLSVQVLISRLRQKLHKVTGHKLIQTRRGEGYFLFDSTI
jgi:DNA-binding response OmpR family regulator